MNSLEYAVIRTARSCVRRDYKGAHSDCHKDDDVCYLCQALNELDDQLVRDPWKLLEYIRRDLLHHLYRGADLHDEVALINKAFEWRQKNEPANNG